MSTGEVAIIKEGNNSLAYVFIQGGTTDTLVQVGTAQITNFSDATLTISRSNSSMIHLNT